MYCKNCKNYRASNRFFGTCSQVFVSNKISDICRPGNDINFVNVIDILGSKVYVNADFGCIKFMQK